MNSLHVLSTIKPGINTYLFLLSAILCYTEYRFPSKYSYFSLFYINYYIKFLAFCQDLHLLTYSENTIPKSVSGRSTDNSSMILKEYVPRGAKLRNRNLSQVP